MPPNLDQLNQLSDFPTASWAIWSEQFPDQGCAEENTADILGFMTEQIDNMNCSVVLLGHNRSPGDNEIWHPFSNFHSIDQEGDRILKDFVHVQHLQNLEGAYMTDLSQEIAPYGVHVYPNQQDFETLTAQIDILSPGLDINETKIVCLGRDTFNELQPFLGLHHRNSMEVHPSVWFSQTQFNGRVFSMYSVNHFAPGRYNRRYVNRLADQLEFINHQI
jgi:hypothetical protein